MQNYQQTIYSQYANSPVLNAIIGYINQWFDPTVNLNAFYNQLWNVQTAQGYGLEVWGRIVGVQRNLQISNAPFFGFSGVDGSSGDSFDVGVFYDPRTATSNYALTDAAFRTLIYAKAYLNISNGSIPSVNNILMTLFGSSGQCWVIDNLNMTLTYYFNFTPSPVQVSIIQTSGVLPRPVGVSTTFVHT